MNINKIMVAFAVFATSLVFHGVAQAVDVTYGGFSREQTINIVARTLYAEAKGEIHEGRLYVATVIWNRAGGDVSKLSSVCLKKKQFSCWNGLSDKQRLPSGIIIRNPKGINLPANKIAWIDVCEIAIEMVGETFTPKGNYNAYLNKATASKNAVNGWGRLMTQQVKVGNHTFGYLREHDGFRVKQKHSSSCNK